MHDVTAHVYDKSLWSIGHIVRLVNYYFITQERQVRVDYYVLICQSGSKLYWLSVVYGYKAVLQIVALVLAIKIRKVKISGLNDTKEVRGTVYIVSGILLVLAINCFFLSKYLNTYSAIFALVGLISGSTVVLGFIFIPKVFIILYIVCVNISLLIR